MAPRPGRIATTFEVAQPRPRDRTGAALAMVRGSVMTALESTIAAQLFDTPRAVQRPAAVSRDLATADGSA
jgi:hypothetical protein